MSPYAISMGFGLGHGRELDDALGTIGVTDQELPPLPDEAGVDARAGFLDPRRWFAGSEKRFEVEIGCGKGTFLLETARACPEVNFLGIEWAREFYLYTADRVRRAQLSNVRMMRTDAGDFLRWRCIDAIVDVIHLYFSDPWPKRKHHKNRVVQHRFLAEAWRVLAPGGQLRIVTDHDELWAWDQEHFAVWTDAAVYAAWSAGSVVAKPEHQGIPTAALPRLGAGMAPFAVAAFTPPSWVGEGEVVGTNYERKFSSEAKPPHSVVLRKQKM